MAVYITGDTHGDFRLIPMFLASSGTTAEDVLIILGDAGVNYYGQARDTYLKRQLSKLPVTFFCIHGNHEKRPETVGTYAEAERYGGVVYMEPSFPNLLFAKDGEIYEFCGLRCIAIGGAYSVDNEYRLRNNLGWWADEQPSDEIKARVERRLDGAGWNIDIVLSHTCPYKYMPREAFLNYKFVVDNSTEEWLGAIEERLDYRLWYCGHFHIMKKIDKMRFMAKGIVQLTDI
jgi:3-oxoacid CoA-transferase subunit A